MAVTARKDENGLVVDSRSPQYVQSQAVTDAQQKMQQVQAQQPGAYTPGQQVVAAQQAMQQNLANKPQAYNSKYGAALDSILQQIQGPKDFHYDFNGDELFKYYADLYTQKGRQASMDAMGQAAALTGGYGNSYAQQVGNQAYDQYLLSLYDKGLEFRDRAYQQHQDQIADMYNEYNVLSGQDQIDYGRYRDTVGDWERERDYLTGRYDTERNIDYGQYRDAVADWQNNRDYYTNYYNNERNFDYGQFTDQRAFDEQVRQFNESLNWEKMSSDQKYAAEYCMQILANGQMPSEDLLMAAGLTPEDAQKMMAQIAAGGSGGGGKSKAETYYQLNGQYYQKNKDGTWTEVSESKALGNKNNIIDNIQQIILDEEKKKTGTNSQHGSAQKKAEAEALRNKK